MIARYTHPEMGRIWSDQRRYETWLLVEAAAAEAMAAAGIVPAEAARDIRERGGFDIARIEEIEQRTQHDVIAFTEAVAEKVGPSARWLHFGMTSSDVIDTAQALQMREACDVILKLLQGLNTAVRHRAFEHRRTPMIGRTHGVHAEPTTFGLKLALWHAEIDRDIERVRRARTTISVGKISGAVGTFAHLPPSVEAEVCRRLELEPAPVASQVIQRDRHYRCLAREVRAGNPGPAEDGDRRGRGAVRERAEGLVGDAAQAQPDRVRADCRPGATCPRQLPRRL
jgi:adenylosuccinate lyase